MHKNTLPRELVTIILVKHKHSPNCRFNKNKDGARLKLAIAQQGLNIESLRTKGQKFGKSQNFLKSETYGGVQSSKRVRV